MVLLLNPGLLPEGALDVVHSDRILIGVEHVSLERVCRLGPSVRGDAWRREEPRSLEILLGSD